MATKPKRQSNPVPRPPDREQEIQELHDLGDGLDVALRRIGSYLAWVSRDVKVLRSSVAAIREQEARRAAFKPPLAKKGAKP